MSMPPSASEVPEAPFTAWHVFLVEMLCQCTDLRRVEVRDFVKLGTLPLEADVILLLKKVADDAGALRALMTAELDFLEPRLGELTVIEYKSPKDVLDREAIDVSRAYALLAKRKFPEHRIVDDRQVALVLLYSYAQTELFDVLKQDDLDFVEEEEGIRCCRRAPMVTYAVDLVALAKKRPKNPLNLISARHAQFRADPALDRTMLALVERIQYLIRQGKVRGMALNKLQGFDEVADDTAEIRRRILAGMDPKDRLDLLAGMDPKDRLAGMDPKDILAGMDPKAEEELLKYLLSRRERNQR